jgi:SAM-dependent methyltransferase
MTPFDLYAAYYDLLYGDKNYAAEADYVAAMLPPGARSVLELGSGTGGHALLLAERGYEVHGIDVAPAMVERSLLRRAAAPEALHAKLHFAEGDVRSHRAGRRFDAVLSLFHVMSYQTTNADLAAAFATARAHLDPGGVFVFDFWYGPAVLSDRPREVVKEVEDARILVRRDTTPVVHVNDDRVDVRFDVTIRARDGGAEQRVQEVHPMRYLFLPEIDLFCERAGFERTAARAWLSDHAPSDRSWYACVACRAV